MKKIAVTSGDPNGIGLEVAAKALEKLGPQKSVQFYLFRSNSGELRQLKRLDRSFHRRTYSSLADALLSPYKKSSDLIDIESSSSAPHWVESAAKACHAKLLDGMATAPLSKTLIQTSGYKAKGHTEILQRVAQVSDVHMVFVGQFFNVLLITGHLPLESVPRALTASALEKALHHALSLRKILPPSLRRKPVALLGLNPHAGENGILGPEELRVFLPLLKKFSEVRGPLSPDAAFLKQNWSRYSVFVCPYHDQGLIPFKMIHGAHGYHLTFGLNFVRTSVDHGTAFDIFGKNKADASSMLDAIRACIKLSG